MHQVDYPCFQLRLLETRDGFVTQWNLADGCGRDESGVGGLGWTFLREFKLAQNVNSTLPFIDSDPLRIPLGQSQPRNSSLGSMITWKRILLFRRNLTARGHPP